MRRFLIFTKAMFLIHLRNREVLFWNFAFPVFLMLIYGLIAGDYIAWLTPGVIVLNALSFGLVASAAVLVASCAGCGRRPCPPTNCWGRT